MLETVSAETKVTPVTTSSRSSNGDEDVCRRTFTDFNIQPRRSKQSILLHYQLYLLLSRLTQWKDYRSTPEHSHRTSVGYLWCGRTVHRCTRLLTGLQQQQQQQVPVTSPLGASENEVVAANFRRYILYPTFIDIATSLIFVADIA